MSSSDESDSGPEIECLDISNDKYYKPLAGYKPILAILDEELDIPKYGSRTIQHSLPAYDLWRPFFPTYLSEEKFKNFHRPKLRHFNTGPQARLRRLKPKAFPIKNLSRTIYDYQKKLRYQVIDAINSGKTRNEIINKFLRIHEAKDLTAKRGEVFLFEYSEQYPPILSQIGMASNIKNYTVPSPSSIYPRPVHRTQQKPQNKNDTLTQTSIPGLNTDTNQTSNVGASSAMDSANNTDEQHSNSCTIGVDFKLNPKSKPIYFNTQKAGLKQQVIENNMFRAPIYQHQVPSCDFLIIRTRNSFYIRTVRNIFTVGQTMPLTIIPQPTEAAINKFRLDFSNLYIHKLFMESDVEPPFINFDTFARLFPDYDRKILQRRLLGNGVESFKKGPQLLCKRGTSKYGLSTLQELRALFTPERYCVNMSMLSARQRLRELNYTESMINPANDAEAEIEVLAAPWNTSKAVTSTLAGRCYLDLSKHLIDPTGLQREGFSCVAWIKSPTEDQQIKERMNGSRSVTPPDSLSSIPTKNPLAYKITREKIERLQIYTKEAMHIADVQSNVLSSKEVLSSDDDVDEEEEEENQLDCSFDDQLRDLDKLVVGGQTQQELNFEKEEDERMQMLKEFRKNGFGSTPKRLKLQSQDHDNATSINVAAFKNKVMKIIRTYDSNEGPIQRTEIVRDPKIIALYIKKKGGSSTGSQSYGSQNYSIGHAGDNANRISNANSMLEQQRRSSLGPTELCRADGIVLTISKKVLNPRAIRKIRRDSMRSD